jgi:hypothetical protein
MSVMDLENVRVLVNNTSGFHVFLFGGKFSLFHEIIFETHLEKWFFLAKIQQFGEINKLKRLVAYFH